MGGKNEKNNICICITCSAYGSICLCILQEAEQFVRNDRWEG